METNLTPTKMDKKEIEKAAKHRAEFLKFRLEEDAKFYEECFIEGAEWALSQPKEDKDLLDKMYNYLKNLQTPNVSLEQKPVESEWISVKDKQPERIPNVRYSQVPCLVIYKGQVCILNFNHEHECWDDEDGDDYCCDIESIEFWMPLPQPPETK